MVDSKNSEDQVLLNLLIRLKEWKEYIRSKRKLIIIISICGLLMGVLYSIIKKPIYTAECTFVLEEDKSGGVSQYAGIAAQFGISLSSEGGGIFQGDNIIELYKSNLMIRRALLSKPEKIKELLITRYINLYNVNTTGDGKKIAFESSHSKYSLDQDSIIQAITRDIRAKNLVVEKPDKKLNIISVKVKSTDELFSKEFADAIVKNVNEFYILTKTKKATQNVNIIKHQSDSVRLVLNSAISGVATAIDANPNINPAFKSLLVRSQTRKVDVEASSTIYAELMKNLELAKISLQRETPLIQIIDAPMYPIEVKKPSPFIYGFLGLLAASISCIILLLLNKTVRDAVSRIQDV